MMNAATPRCHPLPMALHLLCSVHFGMSVYPWGSMCSCSRTSAGRDTILFAECSMLPGSYAQGGYCWLSSFHRVAAPVDARFNEFLGGGLPAFVSAGVDRQLMRRLPS